MIRRLPGRLSVLGVACLASACIWPTDEPYLAGEDPPPLVVVDATPTEGAEAVPVDSPVVFLFDGPVHPDSVSSETVWLSAGGGQIPASRRVDLLNCSVTLRPHEPLTSLLTHRAEVVGVYGFSAGPLETALAVTFTTGEATSASPTDTPPTLDELVIDVFSVHCADCHGAYEPAAGLDLSTAESAARTLVGQASVYRSGATRVVPGSHGSSYLMWKLLALPPIEGDPMPPDGDWPGAQTCGAPHPDLRRIASWIDSL